MDDWAKGIETGISETFSGAYATILEGATAGLADATDLESADAATAKYKEVAEAFSEMSEDMSQDERIATFFKMVPMVAATSLEELAEVLGVGTAEMVSTVLAELNKATKQPILKQSHQQYQSSLPRQKKDSTSCTQSWFQATCYLRTRPQCSQI